MEKSIQVKSFPASNGESFLIKCVGEKSTNILIDCGYISTYKVMESELHNLKKNNEKIDLMVLTHIDNDHINGARSILKDYVNDKICEISEIWYNDFFSIYDIEGCSDENRTQEEFKLLKEIIEQKYPNDPNLFKEEVVGYKSANTLVDCLQNEKIHNIINKSRNPCILVENKETIEKSIWINDEVEIILLGPTKEVLVQLLEEWRKHLNEKGFKEEVVKSKKIAKAFELFYVNKIEEMSLRENIEKQCSVRTKLEELLEFNESDAKLENRSSISFILRFYDKYLLFLGDSSPLDYEDVLEKMAQATPDNKLKFDLVKVSHHGSKFNTSNKFFDLVTSDKYIISTNGRGTHNHPDLEAILKIICNQKEDKLIKFNYKPDKIINFINKNKLYQTYNFKLEYENSSLLGVKVMNTVIKDEVKGESNE